MGRILRGWEITKASFKVVRTDKEIMLLPVASAVMCLLVLLTILGVPAALGLLSPGYASALAIVFYLVSSFVIIFFNTALVACAKIRFDGGDPTIRRGLSVASTKAGKILQWSMVAATVGVALRVLRQKGGLLGGIVSAIGGLAWAVSTYFVIPAILYEDLGPIDAISRSLAIIKRTWGEGATAYISTHIIFFLLSLAALPFLLVAFSIFPSSPPLAMLIIASVIVYYILPAVVGTAVDGILTAALYKFSVDGEVPKDFEKANIQTVIY